MHSEINNKFKYYYSSTLSYNIDVDMNVVPKNGVTADDDLETLPRFVNITTASNSLAYNSLASQRETGE